MYVYVAFAAEMEARVLLPTRVCRTVGASLSLLDWSTSQARSAENGVYASLPVDRLDVFKSKARWQC